MHRASTQPQSANVGNLTAFIQHPWHQRSQASGLKTCSIRRAYGVGYSEEAHHRDIPANDDFLPPERSAHWARQLTAAFSRCQSQPSVERCQFMQSWCVIYSVSSTSTRIAHSVLNETNHSNFQKTKTLSPYETPVRLAFLGASLPIFGRPTASMLECMQ